MLCYCRSSVLGWHGLSKISVNVVIVIHVVFIILDIDILLDHFIIVKIH